MSSDQRRGASAGWRHGRIWAAIFLLAGCQAENQSEQFQGYIEAEYLYMASPRGGALINLSVERGQTVTSNAPLFPLDPEPETTARRQAEERVQQYRAQWEDLKKGLRPSEIAALEAKRNQALASLSLAERELKRVDSLYQSQVVPIDDFDRARSTHDLYQAQVAELNAQLETARLGARSDALESARAALEAAQAELAQADWNLRQKAQASPAAGVVHDTLFRPGEWVAPGNPVVVLLPPDQLKVRFFVPQDALSRMQPGAKIKVSFDGAPHPFDAHISYVSTQAEFTPPVIYSQQTRNKLVFMIEARFETGETRDLRPGQPVDVALAP